MCSSAGTYKIVKYLSSEGKNKKERKLSFKYMHN